ncbi:class I SAM-dependent methyltransferase [Leptospira ellinghausenii]|nr:class I SAM-dependent methyltransferase [Leptospira ellinghausenii]
MDFSLYNETYDFFCDSLPISSKILDLGCGPGNITKFLSNKRNDFEIEGTDISVNMINLAKLNNPSLKFFVSDIRKFNVQKIKYNGIISGFCLPYLSLSDIRNLIPKLHNSLKKNGILYISFVQGNPDDSGIKIGKDGRKLYFFYHDINEIKNLLVDSKFRSEKFYSIEYQNNDNSFDTHIIIISKKLNI